MWQNPPEKSAMPNDPLAPRAPSVAKQRENARAAALSASAALGLALLFSASPAAAAPDAAEAPATPQRRVWIDARPWTCIHEVSALARDAELACDALGGHCQVASSEAEATHRAVLTCDPSAARWTLRIETVASEPIVAVTLTGDHEERLRKAAMWIARAEDDGPAEGPPAAAKPAAPTPTPAQAAPARRWLLPIDAHPPPEAPPPKPRKPPGPRMGGLALDGAWGVTNSSHFDSYRGLHASIIFPAGPFHVGVAGTYEQVFSTQSDFSNALQVARIGRVGARAGWGAPFADRVVGLWIETGVAIGTRRAGLIDSSAHRVFVNEDGNPTDFMTPYGRAEVMLQIPFHAPVRPYLAVAGLFALDEFGESVESMQASAGLAWRAW